MPLAHHLDDGAGRRAGLAQAVELACSSVRRFAASGLKKELRSTSAQSQRPRSMAWPPIWISAPRMIGRLSRHMLDDLAGNGAGGNPACGLAGRRPAAAAMVADAVFGPIGVVGMARAELVVVLAVILGTLVLVVDEQADRRAGGLALEHAGEDAHRVALAPLGDEA